MKEGVGIAVKQHMPSLELVAIRGVGTFGIGMEHGICIGGKVDGGGSIHLFFRPVPSTEDISLLGGCLG